MHVAMVINASVFVWKDSSPSFNIADVPCYMSRNKWNEFVVLPWYTIPFYSVHFVWSYLTLISFLLSSPLLSFISSYLNTLLLSGTIWRDISWSTLIQVMACRQFDAKQLPQQLYAWKTRFSEISNKKNEIFLIQENLPENAICKMATILSSPAYVKSQSTETTFLLENETRWAVTPVRYHYASIEARHSSCHKLNYYVGTLSFIKTIAAHLDIWCQ